MKNSIIFPHFCEIPMSEDPIADVQEMANIVWERWEAVMDNPDVSDNYKEFLAELYFISIGVFKALDSSNTFESPIRPILESIIEKYVGHTVDMNKVDVCQLNAELSKIFRERDEQWKN